MFDHVEGGRQVKRFVAEGQRLCQALLHLQALLAAKLKCVVRNIDALSRAELREHFDIGSGAAADIKNVDLFSFSVDPGQDLPKKTLEYRAPSYEPPVRALDLVHNGVCVLLHLLRQCCVHISILPQNGC